ncbi:MAG: imidazole glycerol phosphate synthase subunit HisH [Lachnospiraceae bacterium]|nr:imidazole glycerol phosphate synthase subunit HisH [Lachnospiraceae bacterium]
MVAIIDYDAGNIRSVEKALLSLGADVKITSDPGEILSADHVILPGVGSFGSAMEQLKERGLVEVIKEVAKLQKPLLGICLGLQLLFEDSEESVGVDGLGILKGHIRRLPEGDGRKIPHIGWNDLSYPNKGDLFRDIPEGKYVYFVHSYYLEATDPSIVTATCNYGALVHASVQKDRVYACQFHPEKSSDVGLTILKNFLES